MSGPWAVAVARNTRELTTRAGVSPEQIAKSLELTPHAVERRLSGTKAWTIPELVALAHLLRRSVVDLVDVELGSEAPTPMAARRHSDE